MQVAYKIVVNCDLNESFQTRIGGATQTLTLFECRFEKQRFQRGIQLFRNIFEQNWSSELYGILQGSHVVRVCQFDNR